MGHRMSRTKLRREDQRALERLGFRFEDVPERGADGDEEERSATPHGDSAVSAARKRSTPARDRFPRVGVDDEEGKAE